MMLATSRSWATCRDHRRGSCVRTFLSTFDDRTCRSLRPVEVPVDGDRCTVTTGLAGLVAGWASTERAAAAQSDKRVTCYGTSVVSGLSASIIHMPSTEASVVPGLREI
jgi:hypothetical protein